MFTKNDEGEVVLEHAQINADRLIKIALQRDVNGYTSDTTAHVMFSNQLTSLCGDEFTLEDLGSIVAEGQNKQGRITCKTCYNRLTEMYDKTCQPRKVVELLDHGYQDYLGIWYSIFREDEFGIFIDSREKIKATLKLFTYEQHRWALNARAYLGGDRKENTFADVYGINLIINNDDFLQYSLYSLSLFYTNTAEYEQVKKDD